MPKIKNEKVKKNKVVFDPSDYKPYISLSNYEMVDDYELDLRQQRIAHETGDASGCLSPRQWY